MTHPADLGVVESVAVLRERRLSSRELVDACLERIRERDGVHSHDGDPQSLNAWIRVYEEDARAAAAAADERLARPEPPPLCGVPIGLKDLYAVAGKPLTASSRLLDETPDRSCDVWQSLERAGMVLLGHLHTHEFALGGTTDQVGNPWAPDRSPGGSSGGSAAALAARMVAAATGTDTGGSLRIPSALSGVSALKPTYGSLSLRGIVPLSTSLDHPGPMARTLEDCGALLAAMTPGRAEPPATLAGVRLALSPRAGLTSVDADTADGLERALDVCRGLGATIVEPPAPPAPLDVFDDFLVVLLADLLTWHRRFDGRRELYRQSIREFVEMAEQRALSAEAYVAAATRRREATWGWLDWFASERLSALLEPTVAIVAPVRGGGYEHPLSDTDLLPFTHYWNWTGFPVAALPSGVGPRSGLPVGVQLIGPSGSDWRLLSLGITLQRELGVPQPPDPQ